MQTDKPLFTEDFAKKILCLAANNWSPALAGDTYLEAPTYDSRETPQHFHQVAEVVKSYHKTLEAEKVPEKLKSVFFRRQPRTFCITLREVLFRFAITAGGKTVLRKVVDSTTWSIHMYTGVVSCTDMNGKRKHISTTPFYSIATSLARTVKWLKGQVDSFQKQVLIRIFGEIIDRYEWLLSAFSHLGGNYDVRYRVGNTRYKQPSMRQLWNATSWKTFWGDTYKIPVPRYLNGLPIPVIVFIMSVYTKEEIHRLKDSVLMSPDCTVGIGDLREHLDMHIKVGRKPRLYYKTEKAFQADHFRISVLAGLRGAPDISPDSKYPEIIQDGEVTAKLLATREDLVREGIQMQHCVASYGSRINSGKCAVYKVTISDEWRLTMQLSISNDNFVITQLKGKHNQPAPDSVYEKLEAALGSNNIPVLSRKNLQGIARANQEMRVEQHVVAHAEAVFLQDVFDGLPF